jgi:hypothetical protein
MEGRGRVHSREATTTTTTTATAANGDNETKTHCISQRGNHQADPFGIVSALEIIRPSTT